MVFVEVNLFCFQASEPAFNHDVIRPAGFPIHALPNLKFLQQPLIFIAGKLTSLVAVDNGRCPVFLHSPADRRQDLRCAQRMSNFQLPPLSSAFLYD